MTKEEFKDEVKKIIGVRAEVVRIDWVKMTSGQYYIALSIKASARQTAKLKPILSEFYQQELT